MVRNLAIFVLLILSNILVGQTLTIDIQKDTISTDSIFTITYSIDDNCNFDPLDFTDFHIVMGPSISRSMNIINGNMTQKTSLTYQLKPKSSGVFYFPNLLCDTKAEGEAMIVVIEGYESANDREKRILSKRKIKKI